MPSAAQSATSSLSAEGKPQAASSDPTLYRNVMLAGLVWWAIIVYFYTNVRCDTTRGNFIILLSPCRVISEFNLLVAALPQTVTLKTSNSCLASSNVITVLEMVPYLLHSSALSTAVYTINQKYNIQASFSDVKDPQAAAVFASNPSQMEDPSSTSSGVAGFRKYNKFSLSMPFPNTIVGSTNWMEYQIVFNNIDDVSATCLEPFKTFKFINFKKDANGESLGVPDTNSCQGCWPCGSFVNCP